MVITGVIYLCIGCLCWIWYICWYWYILKSTLLNDYKTSLTKYAIIGSVFLFAFIAESISYICQHVKIIVH